jgi:hypothetical protein
MNWWRGEGEQSDIITFQKYSIPRLALFNMFTFLHVIWPQKYLEIQVHFKRKVLLDSWSTYVRR